MAIVGRLQARDGAPRVAYSKVHDHLAQDVTPISTSGVIDIARMKRLVRSGEAIIVDVRPAKVYARGHIPGARNISLEKIKSDGLSELRALLEGSKLPMALYCGSSSCKDSSIAAGKLLEAGVAPERVLVFKGGWLEWVRERGRIATSPAE